MRSPKAFTGIVCDFHTGHLRLLTVRDAFCRSMCFPAKIPLHSLSALQINMDYLSVIDSEITLQSSLGSRGCHYCYSIEPFWVGYFGAITMQVVMTGLLWGDMNYVHYIYLHYFII